MGDDMAGVLARLRRLEDREEIRDLVYRYAIINDNKDVEGLSLLYTPDGRQGFWAFPDAILEGREAIAQFYRVRFAECGPRFHCMHDQIVDWDAADENRATGLVTGHCELWTGGQQYVAAMRYDDVYVRPEGRWRFQERMVGCLYFTTTGEYDRILGETDRFRTYYGSPRPGQWPKELVAEAAR